MNLGGDEHECVREGLFPEPSRSAISEASVSPASNSAGVAVLGVEAKRRRLDSDENYLETEDDVPPSDLEEFVDRMSSLKVERGTR